MGGLVLDELEETLGYDSSEYYWLVKIVDQYHRGYIGATAFWIWTCKTLYDTDTLHLLEDCRIFLSDEDNDLEHLNKWLERVAALANDPEGFRELCFDLQLPIGHVEWEAVETQRRVEEIRSREMVHRETRSGPTNDESQALVDESSLGAEPSQVTAQAAVKNQERMAELRAILINKRLARSSDPATLTANMAGPNKEQKSPESTNSPAKQSSTSDQPANNKDAEMVQQPSKSPNAQPKRSDFTFEMPREGGPVKSPQFLRPVDMPVASAMSAAAPHIAPTAMPATEPASAGESAATHKFPKSVLPATSLESSAPSETTKRVECTDPSTVTSPGIPKTPVWKSPWKYDVIPFTTTIPQFPTSDMRNDSKGKQSMNPPSAPASASASAYKTNGGPSSEHSHKPVESPVKYTEPLSDDEGVPAVPAPVLTGLTTEKQAAIVYQQLLAHGERQKAVTGKYRSVADDVRAQAGG
ncbi:hypothetical protein M436DRAFT_82629 [Aureobasidium namibiae CBS 147.97]|uniref:Uncharacterized protein n=1 Tax=Aureobasidium namibiae CBS 147.97 TaxID=1043004 RepID=A0A074WHF3_9PEZI